MRTFAAAVSIVVSTEATGVSPGDLAGLAIRLEELGVDALFVTADPELEPITALAGIAPICDLVLGAVVPLAFGRVPTIVAKRATTLAMLAENRAALVFRNDDSNREVELLEAVKAASMMGGDGPLDFVGSTIRLIGAYNEPRPERGSALGIGAWTASPTPMLGTACDLLIVDGPAEQVPVDGPLRVSARRGTATARAPIALPDSAVLVEIEGGDLDRICAIASSSLQLRTSS